MGRFAVGIDLGTTNCALAYIRLVKGEENPKVETFQVPQLMEVGEFGRQPLLPSFVYIPGEHELPAGGAAVPWNPAASLLVGEAARRQGGRVPGRLVQSAKSWLCHSAVDRQAAILPWNADAEVKRLSPVRASALLLEHLRDAWNFEFAKDDDANRLEKQRIVLTVPASFDESAREMTVEAAKEAGLVKLTLLEEPQAAFYDWLYAKAGGQTLPAGSVCVVVDCGGGTTDFSLIAVDEEDGEPTYERLAVGDHLLLGGDNMDIAIALAAEQILTPGKRLSPPQWGNLVQAARLAKEIALSPDAPDRLTINVRGRGGKMIGESLRCEMDRTAIKKIALDGFLPFVLPEDDPGKAARGGLQEFGLPFVADPAVTKHLSYFLRQHSKAVEDARKRGGERSAQPTALLYNGGVFNASACRDRVYGVMKTWYGPDWEPAILETESYDLAVAKGAAYFAWVKETGAPRIAGGAARSYYVGIGVDDKPGKTTVLCVAPHGLAEGELVKISEPPLELQIGEPVRFPLYSSTVRTKDKAGKVFQAKAGQLSELPALVATLKGGKRAGSKRVGVRLETMLTEIGTLELYCAAKSGTNRWRLHLQTRATPAVEAAEATPNNATGVYEAWSEEDLEGAVEAIDAAFPKRAKSVDPKIALGLVRDIETAVELPRLEWPPGLLRGLWEPLMAVAARRGMTPEHEARWYNMAGFCLRPGWGDALDGKRIDQIWKLVTAGPENPRNARVWAEMWILCRRIAGGFDGNRQKELAKKLLPIVLPGGKKASQPPVPQDMAECWRAAASLERLTVDSKVELGREAVRQLAKTHAPSHLFWAITRLGSRSPLYGPVNEVTPRDETGAWVEKLLELPDRARNDVGFAISILAKMTGDRARDLDDDLRQRVVDRLKLDGAPLRWLEGVQYVTEWERAEQGKLLGDALPPGLHLAGD